jgi:formylglycine-generating enzyme required for sulfatase activity
MTENAYSPDQQRLLTMMQDMRHSIEVRAQAGKAIAEIGDPRAGVGLGMDGLPDIAWCEVPGTDKDYRSSMIGGDDDAHQSLLVQIVDLPTFWISKYPITYAQFQPFINANGFANDRWWQQADERESYPQGFEYRNHPRECVTWFAAMAYCRWLSVALGYEVRLPTESEWEKAARGGDGRWYPWGNEYIHGYANLNETYTDGPHCLDMTSAVGIYPADSASPYGVMDMAGNVWEWTLSAFESGNKAREVQAGHPLQPMSERVLRGGSWLDGVQRGRSASRLKVRPDDWSRFFGFRLVCRLPS